VGHSKNTSEKLLHTCLLTISNYINDYVCIEQWLRKKMTNSFCVTENSEKSSHTQKQQNTPSHTHNLKLLSTWETLSALGKHIISTVFMLILDSNLEAPGAERLQL